LRRFAVAIPRATDNHEKVFIMKSFDMSRVFALSPAAVGLLGALMVVSFAPTSANAQQTAEQACTPDVMRLCQQFVPDRARIGACLAHNKRQLSPACRSVMSTPKSSKKQRRASN
jgi:hypothetical protein